MEGGYGLQTGTKTGQYLISRFPLKGGRQMPIRVLLADDQRLFRQSLKYLLEQEGDIEVVAEAADGQDAFTL